jgi:hypothetical protein
MEDLAIACNLTPGELAERGADLLPGLVARSSELRAVEHGYALRFESKDAEVVFAVIASERQCCPFFRFEITLEPAAGPIWLTLTGPAGTREFIEGFLPSRAV